MTPIEGMELDRAIRLMRGAERLGAARKAWALEFLRLRTMSFQTDAQAKAAADVAPDNEGGTLGEAVILAEARYEIAKALLHGGKHDDPRPVPQRGPDEEPTEAATEDEGPSLDCG